MMSDLDDRAYAPERGTVIAADPAGRRATVSLSRTEACQFCGQCAASAEDGRMLLEAALDPDCPAADLPRPGDTVIVRKDPKAQTHAILLLLVLPLAALLAAALLGALLFPGSIPVQAALIIGALALSFAAARLLSKALGWQRRPGIYIVKE